MTINFKTLLSAFNEKGTLLKWLQKLEAALSNSTLTDVEIETLSTNTIRLKFLFNDGTSIDSSVITLPRGEQGEPGRNGTDGITPTFTATAYAVTAEKGEAADARVSVTKSTGAEKYNLQFDFDIPAGEQGEPGRNGTDGNGIEEVRQMGFRDTADGYTETELDIVTKNFTKTVNVYAKNGKENHLYMHTVYFDYDEDDLSFGIYIHILTDNPTKISSIEELKEYNLKIYPTSWSSFPVSSFQVVENKIMCFILNLSKGYADSHFLIETNISAFEDEVTQIF